METFEAGEKVMVGRFEGVIIERCDWSDYLYNVRLPGGEKCTDADSITKLSGHRTMEAHRIKDWARRSNRY